MKLPIYIIQVIATAPGKEEQPARYLYVDENGHTGYDERLKGAEMFTDLDRAHKRLDMILDEKPVTYGSGAFSRHAINFELRRAVDEKIDHDGIYSFEISLIELRGKNLNDLFTVPWRVHHFKVEQNHNKPDVLPVYTHTYRGGDRSGQTVV